VDSVETEGFYQKLTVNY